MRSQVVIGSGFVAKYPQGGGNYWVPLQYLRGFRDLGVDVLWLEVLESTGDPTIDQAFIQSFLRRAEEMAVTGHAAVAFFPSGMRNPQHREVFGLSARELDERMRDALLLNMAGSLNKELRVPFARSILFDLDPGFFQIWASQWGMGVGEHDLHLTIGHHLGAADCPIPTNGIEWYKTWPAVHIPSWPRASGPGRCYTTVTQWWSQEGALFDGELYEYSKRHSFFEVRDLPRRASPCLELAANIHPSELQEIELFTSHGWRLVQPEQVVQTPQQYQDYVQTSRGEFGCAKPGYAKGRTGWLSDRSVCYLASGRPCVLQDTAASLHLPESRALRFFTSEDTALAAIETVEREYEAASREARELAEDVFSTRVLLPRLLTLGGM